jgi:hypothetical protein
MSYVSVQVDVDIDEFISELGWSEKKQLLRDLAEDLDLAIEQAEETGPYHPDEEMYRTAVRRLIGSYSRLPVEEIDRIAKLADRYGEY